MIKKRIITAFALFSAIFLINGVKASAQLDYDYTSPDYSGSVSGNQSQNHNGNGGSGSSRQKKYVYLPPADLGSKENPIKNDGACYVTGAGTTVNQKFVDFYNSNINGTGTLIQGWVGSEYPIYTTQSDGSVVVTYYQTYVPSVIANVTTTPIEAQKLDILDHYVWWRTGVDPLAQFNSNSNLYDYTPSVIGKTSVHCYGVRKHIEENYKNKNGNVVLGYKSGKTVNIISKSDSGLDYYEVTTYPLMPQKDWPFNITAAEVGHVISTDYYKTISITDKSASADADTQLIQ